MEICGPQQWSCFFQERFVDFFILVVHGFFSASELPEIGPPKNLVPHLLVLPHKKIGPALPILVPLEAKYSLFFASCWKNIPRDKRLEICIE